MSILGTLSDREIDGCFYSYKRGSRQEKENRLGILSILPKKEFFNVLLTSYKNAIFTMQNPALHQKLTLTERLRVFGKHKPLAIEVLNHTSLCDELAGTDLAIFGQSIPEIAKRILKTPELCNKLSSTDLATLGRSIPKIAECILKTSELCNKLSSTDLAILNAPKLCHELDNTGLAIIPAERILNAPELCDKLSYADLATLGQSIPEIAERILKTPELCKKLYSHVNQRYALERTILIWKMLHEICLPVANKQIRILPEERNEDALEEDDSNDRATTKKKWCSLL